MKPPKQIKKIRSSLLGRGFKLAQLTAETGIGLASYGAKTLLSSQAEKTKQWSNFLKERAAGLSEDLGQLKGSLMKAGQMLSMYGEHFLPAEANELLRSLQSQSHALSWDVMLKTLQENLSAELLATLEINEVPIGSASIGQVHLAKIKASGEMLALKIQYPGVEAAIDSDLRALRTLLKWMNLLPKNLRLDAIFEEVRSMLVQEMNYPQEIQQTLDYSERLKGDSRFVVPRVRLEYCGPKVIATSYEPGISLNDTKVQELSQERRNRIALNFVDLYLKELFEWGCVQTDPHAGNYLLRLSEDGQDQLVLLDFGAVRTYSSEFLIPYRKMILSSLQNDRDGLRAAALQLKFLQAGDSAELMERFEKFCLMTVEPFLATEDSRNIGGQINEAGEYDWRGSQLPQRLTKQAFEVMQKFELRTPPSELLFLDRKTGGVFIFCSMMRAKINARGLLTRYLKKELDQQY